MSETYTGETMPLLDVTPRDLVAGSFGELAYIGIIALAWSRLEALLAHYFALLVFGIREAPDTGEQIAIESFELAKSFAEKRDLMLQATLKRVNRKTKNDFRKVLKQIHRAGEDRNNIMHGRWSITKQKPHLLVRYERAASSELPRVWKAKDFYKSVDDIHDAERALVKFFNERIAERLKPVAQPGFGELLAALQGKDSG